MTQWLALWSWYVLPLSAWVASMCSRFLSQYKDTHIRLTGDPKWPIGVNMSVYGCLSLCVIHLMN